MTQSERRRWLIEYLLKEGKDRLDTRGIDQLWETEEGEKQLLRALFNVRPPEPASEEFFRIQDAYLQDEIAAMGITQADQVPEIAPGIRLWRGDITSLACDAIVNAANEFMLGCFIPNHRCIDNAIHTYAGVQLRLRCAELMNEQGYPEPTGRAKITDGYNLPARHILHTVGPIVTGAVTDRDRRLLEDCYISCLDLAWENGLRQVAFCCISTGEFHFPNVLAAQIAVAAVNSWRRGREAMQVIFNVFKEEDYVIYEAEI
ncbi:MAG: protein-ADP-ribose hydrolase [Clostridia bacterium]|nr:protein-ADP-ribose hydrolase [Clostridia bacterium]